MTEYIVLGSNYPNRCFLFYIAEQYVSTGSILVPIPNNSYNLLAMGVSGETRWRGLGQAADPSGCSLGCASFMDRGPTFILICWWFTFINFKIKQENLLVLVSLKVQGTNNELNL